MRQETPQTSNTPTMEVVNTSVREGLSASIAREAVYLDDSWEEHIRPEFDPIAPERAGLWGASIARAKRG